MSALALFSELSERGIKIRPNGRNVAVSPERALTPDLRARIKSEKPTLIRELEKVRREAGADWEEIAGNPRQLKAFYELLMIEDMRRHGVVPNHYTSTTVCKRCGPVPIWNGCPAAVQSCPWCFNRIKGLQIPKVNNNE